MAAARPIDHWAVKVYHVSFSNFAHKPPSLGRRQWDVPECIRCIQNKLLYSETLLTHLPVITVQQIEDVESRIAQAG